MKIVKGTTRNWNVNVQLHNRDIDHQMFGNWGTLKIMGICLYATTGKTTT